MSKIFGNNSEQALREQEESATKIKLKVDIVSQKIANIYTAIEEEALPGLAKRAKALEEEREALELQYRDSQKQVAVARMSDGVGKDRMSMILSFVREQKLREDEERRVVREALSEQIRAIVEKIVMYPGGPTCKKEHRDIRYFKVFFKSGQVVEME
jgi:hypothetical protein